MFKTAESFSSHSDSGCTHCKTAEQLKSLSTTEHLDSSALKFGGWIWMFTWFLIRNWTSGELWGNLKNSSEYVRTVTVFESHPIFSPQNKNDILLGTHIKNRVCPWQTVTVGIYAVAAWKGNHPIRKRRKSTETGGDNLDLGNPLFGGRQT